MSDGREREREKSNRCARHRQWLRDVKKVSRIWDCDTDETLWVVSVILRTLKWNIEIHSFSRKEMCALFCPTWHIKQAKWNCQRRLAERQRDESSILTMKSVWETQLVERWWECIVAHRMHFSRILQRKKESPTVTWSLGKWEKCKKKKM